MYEFNYKITEEDMTAENKSTLWSYFIPYTVISGAGLAAGITATVLRPRVELLIFGILLIVLSALLAVCAIVLVCAPRVFVESSVMTGDMERNVAINGGGVRISTDGEEVAHYSFASITKVKKRKTYLVLTVGKNEVFLVKCGGIKDEVYGFLRAKIKEYKSGADVLKAEVPPTQTDDADGQK